MTAGGKGPVPSGSRETTASVAPARAASETKAWPSVRVPASAKNAAPRSRRRVSIEYDVSRAAGSPMTSRPPVAWRTSPTLSTGMGASVVADLREARTRDRAVVERDRAIRELLSRLVSFAGHDDRVAWAGSGESRRDGGGSILDHPRSRGSAGDRGDARLDLA